MEHEPVCFELVPHDLNVAMRELWERAARGTVVAKSRKYARLGPRIMLGGVWLAGGIIVASTIYFQNHRKPPPHTIDLVIASVPFVVVGLLGAWALAWQLGVSRWIGRTLRTPSIQSLLRQQELALTPDGLSHTIGDQRAVYGWGSIQGAFAGTTTIRVHLTHERYVFIPRRAFANSDAAVRFATEINCRQSPL